MYYRSVKTLQKLSDIEPLISIMSDNIIENAGFIFRVRDNPFQVFADKELTAAIAIQNDSDHCMFWGDWQNIKIPFEEII